MDRMADWIKFPEFSEYKPHNNTDWSEITKPLTEAERASGDYSERTDFYTQHAAEYDTSYVTKSYAGRYVAITLHKYLDDNEEAEIIDVGCGTGDVSKQLKKYGNYPNVTGLEPSKGMLEIAKERGLLKTAIHAYFEKENDNLPSNKWDAAIGAGIFAPAHVHPNAVFEMARIVKPGGVIVLVYRKTLIERGEIISQLPTYLKRVVDEGVCEKLEHSTFEYFPGVPGKIWVGRKL